MQRQFILILLIAISICAGCKKKESAETRPGNANQEQQATARYHFVGLNEVLSDTNGATLKAVGNLPETHALIAQTIEKLAKTPRALFANAAGTNDYSDVIRPLLQELMQNESYGELLLGTNQTSEWVLAVKLNKERANAWRTNIATVLKSWSDGQSKDVETAGFKGWELKHTTNNFRFVEAGEWISVSGGPGNLVLQEQLLERIKSQGRPVASAHDEYWLSVWAGPEMFPGNFAISEADTLPEIHLTVAGKGNDIRTKGTATFSKPLEMNFEPWTIPTNTIRDPLVSFTAMQGVNRWIRQLGWIGRIKVDTYPKQYFLWAQQNIPFQSFVLAKMDSATNQFEHIAPQIIALTVDLAEKSSGKIDWTSNKTAVAWTGIPFISPIFHPTTDSGSEYLFGGLFPLLPSITPPPPELLGQIIGRTNLVYYDWEITQERSKQWRGISQLFQIIAGQMLPKKDAPGEKWLDVIGPFLGNSVTEITKTDEQELSLVRKSPIGLTGVELAYLARWLDAPKFPLDATYPPPAFKQLKTGAGAPGADTIPGAPIAPAPSAPETNTAPAAPIAPAKPAPGTP